MYAIFLVVQTGLWTSVLRQDRYDHPEYLSLTRAYATGMGLSVVAILASAFLSAGPRLTVWAGFAFAWVVGITLLSRGARAGLRLGIAPTDSLVERLGCSSSSSSARSCSGPWTACPRPTVTP